MEVTAANKDLRVTSSHELFFSETFLLHESKRYCDSKFVPSPTDRFSKK
jgi:hypothetical protein